MKFSTGMQSKIYNKIQKTRGFIQHQISFFKKKKFGAGFTLIEIMVAVSIFSIVMLVAIGSVLSIVSANRKAQALNSVINNLNFSLEGMVRDLRTGYNYDCDSDTSSLTDCSTDGTDAIYFYSSQYKGNVSYSLINNAIKKTVVGTANDFSLDLTGSEVEIESLVFYVADTNKATQATNPDYFQPKIIITVGGAFKGFGTPTVFNLQTMVTQRKLDI